MMQRSAQCTSPVRIDVSLVQELIQSQFPQWAHLPIKPVAFGGWDNRTFHLGHEMTVRLPSADRYAQQVEKEQHWLPKLALHLPLPIPKPLKLGFPTSGYPWHWSIYRWIEGDIAAIAPVKDLSKFAASLANFLNTLQNIDTSDGPPPGAHNFFRGGSLEVYHQETLAAIEVLADKIDTDTATALWNSALKAAWRDPPVWVHGDVSASNLLVKDGVLSAVIDFGCSAVGDPACDLTIVWTFLTKKSRDIFRSIITANEGTWARARGWALWKALITLAEHGETNPLKCEKAQQVIDAVLSEYKSGY